MSQTNAREIAERIVNNPNDIGGSVDFYRASEILARAYLELEKECSAFNGDLEVLKDTAGLYKQSKQNWFNLQAAKSEIAKLKEENERLRMEIIEITNGEDI